MKTEIICVLVDPRRYTKTNEVCSRFPQYFIKIVEFNAKTLKNVQEELNPQHRSMQGIELIGLVFVDPDVSLAKATKELRLQIMKAFPKVRIRAASCSNQGQTLFEELLRMSKSLAENSSVMLATASCSVNS